MDFLELAARPLFLLARFLLWFAWDFFCLTIFWWIGWPLMRAVSLGRGPHAGLREYDDAGTGEAFVVCGIGFAALAGTAWLLAVHYGPSLRRERPQSRCPPRAMATIDAPGRPRHARAVSFTTGPPAHIRITHRWERGAPFLAGSVPTQRGYCATAT